jgi:hypothetical protein
MGRQAKKQWCVFWGWQDQGDADVRFTASREGAEESNDTLGTVELIYNVLNQHETIKIFNYALLLNMGELSEFQRNAFVARFRKARSTTVIPSKREMSKIKWFPIESLAKATAVAKETKSEDIVLSEFEEKEKIRTFMATHLVWVPFSKDPLLSFVEKGILPFKTPDSQIWKWFKSTYPDFCEEKTT